MPDRIHLPGDKRPLKLSPKEFKELFSLYGTTRTPKQALARKFRITRVTLDSYLDRQLIILAAIAELEKRA